MKLIKISVALLIVFATSNQSYAQQKTKQKTKQKYGCSSEVPSNNVSIPDTTPGRGLADN